MMNKFSVVTTPSNITILYDGNEVLYWDKYEWEEDPAVTISIVNAVIQAYTEPDRLFSWLKSKKIF